MSITISESPAVESFRSAWANMVEAIEPDIDMLPAVWRNIFEGPINLMMSSTLALGIIPEKRMWAMIGKMQWIYSLIKYPDFINYDLSYIATQIGEFFSTIELSMSINGQFLLEGPMSRSFVSQTSKVIQPQLRGRRSYRPPPGGEFQ
uniref:Uncharacterized protein n=1 Tax=viral metagenome TaxID=1070528 RepID=A0A6M3LXP2_9ZZZZ